MTRLLLFLPLLVSLAACSGKDAPGAPAPLPVPNYTGIWSGTYTVSGCTQSGTIALANLCSNALPGTILAFQLNLGQVGSTITQGTFTLGQIPFTITPATLSPTGTVNVSGTNVSGSVTIFATWSLNSPINGTLLQTWTSSGLTGQLNIAANIGAVVKTGSVKTPPLAVPHSLSDLMHAMQAN